MAGQDVGRIPGRISRVMVALRFPGPRQMAPTSVPLQVAIPIPDWDRKALGLVADPVKTCDEQGNPIGTAYWQASCLRGLPDTKPVVIPCS